MVLNTGPCRNCQSNNNSIFAKLHENILNLSEEIEKNTENMPHLPPKKAKLKIAPSKWQYPHKFFSLATIRVLSRTYVQNFIRN